jgi:hypothetical protein
MRLFPLDGARQVEPTGPECWVGWHEEWTCYGRGNFAFRSAGWTIFWGVEHNLQKAPLFRAEWFQRREDEPANANGQPHWHVDYPIGGLQSFHRTSPVPSAVLEEFEPQYTPGSQRDLGSEPVANGLWFNEVHLGMAGWEHGAKQHPACWQRDFSDLSRDLSTWSHRSLLYLQDQLDPRRSRISLH